MRLAIDASVRGMAGDIGIASLERMTAGIPGLLGSDLVVLSELGMEQAAMICVGRASDSPNARWTRSSLVSRYRATYSWRT